ncbi:MAG TPA: CHAT domain-containing protein [Terriglobales bacterium]|nr:CHAT domain-containing protein [Terriglobales bacterium]
MLGAQEDADRAYQQYVKISPDWAARFRVLEAEILLWRGMNENAFALLDSELPPALASDESSVRRLIIQGLTCCSPKQFATAEQYLANAQKLAVEHQPMLLGEVALSFGTLSLRRNDYLSAQSEFQRALKIARQEKQSFLEARALGSLGVVEMNQQRYGEAIDWFQASSAISQSINARALTAKTEGNLGWGHYKMGDWDTALELFIDAEAVSAQLGLQKDQLNRLVNIGNVHYERREFDAAQGYYQRALVISKQLGDKQGWSVCVSNLAEIAIENHQFSDAERYNQEAFDLQRESQNRISQLYFPYNRAQIAMGERKFLQAKELLQEVIRGSSGDFSLQWMAQAKLAKVYAALKQPELADHEFRNALATFDRARALLTVEEYKLTFLTSALHFYNDYLEFLVQRGKITEALHVVELNRARTLAEGLELKQGRPSATSAQFQPEGVAKRANAIVLSYWLATERSYLWAITPSRTAMFVLPGESEINRTVERYRKTLAGPRDPREIADASGQRLYEMLVAPAQKLIPKGSHIAIIPSGSLYELNFETLLAPGPQLHYWIEDVVVSNASSLLLLRGVPSAKEDFKKKLLLIGNPVSPFYPPLPQAASEVENVKQYFSSDRVQAYTGKSATARAYLDSNPQDFSLIHFVAHGVASRESPLDSAVILSGDESSYKLYARDIVAGKRLHAKLVTISSCEGASGKTYAGEGLVGLSWAFLRAGAHQVIAALWDVNDASTSQFMSKVYEQLNVGEDPVVALRTAKLAMLHSDSIYRRPFYWAPFQLYKGL